MAIKDFFWFKKGEYEERIKDRSRYSDERIHRERSHKARQQFSGCWSIGNGLLCCIATGGLTTGIVLYDYRNRSVSKRKLELLEKEAEMRGMKKYDQGTRDFWISCLSNSVHCFTGCKVDSCLAGMLAEAPVPSYIKDVVQADSRSKAVAQEQEHNLAKTTDNLSKELANEEVQVNKQVQARITEGLESHFSEPHGTLEKEVPIGKIQSVPTVQDAARVQVKQPTTPVQGQDRLTHVSGNRVSEPHALQKEARRRGIKNHQKRKRDFWISCLSSSVGFCVGPDSCLIDMLPEALVPNVQDVVQMTDVKPTGAGPNTAVEGQDGITLHKENQVSELHALEKEAGRHGMKKREKRKRDFWISCISNSVGFCIGPDSCLAGMSSGEPVPRIEDVDQMTNVKPLEAGAEARNPITAQMTDNPTEAVRAQAEKLNTRVEGQDTITVFQENQVSEPYALQKAGRRDMKKREKRKLDLLISRISNSVGFCIGYDSCLTDMLRGELVSSGESDVDHMTDVKPSEAGAQAGKPITVHMTDNPSKVGAQVEKINTREEGQDTINLSKENQVSETRALGKKTGRRGMKKREKTKRDFLIACMSNSVGCCVSPDSCLLDMLHGAPSVEDALQKTDVKPSEGGAQAREWVTVQMTDNLLKAEAQLEMTNTEVEDRMSVKGLEDHVSEPYPAVCPASDLQRASPVPGNVLSCEGMEAAEYRVAVASALEAESNGGEFASINQRASSELAKVDISSTLPDSALDKLS